MAIRPRSDRPSRDDLEAAKANARLKARETAEAAPKPGADTGGTDVPTKVGEAGGGPAVNIPHRPGPDTAAVDTGPSPTDTPSVPLPGGSQPAVTGPGAALADRAQLTDRSASPGVDQGFASPSESEVAAAADNAGIGPGSATNPTDAFGTGRVTGPLADAAARDSGVTSIAQQGTDAIGVVFKGTTQHFGDHSVNQERVLDENGRVVKIITSEHFDSLRTEENPAGVLRTTEEDFETGLTTTFEHLPDGTRKVTPDPDAPPDDFAFAIPSEDAPNLEGALRFLADNPAIAEQIAAARGGSGVIDPVDDDGFGTGAIIRPVTAPTDTMRNLVGQPPIAAEQRGPSSTVPTFTDPTGAGAVNPGPDGTNPAGGGRDDDPLAGFDRPAPVTDRAITSPTSHDDDTATTHTDVSGIEDVGDEPPHDDGV